MGHRARAHRRARRGPRPLPLWCGALRLRHALQPPPPLAHAARSETPPTSAAPRPPPAEALKRSPEGSSVVGVVGSSHVEGILEAWYHLVSEEQHGGASAGLLSGRAAASASAGASAAAGAGAGAAPAPASSHSSPEEEMGVRRALIERALVIRGAADVAEMIDEMLGPLPEAAVEAYEARTAAPAGRNAVQPPLSARCRRAPGPAPSVVAAAPSAAAAAHERDLRPLADALRRG